MISIIIPAFGAEPYLPHLIEEIKRFVEGDYEILIQSEKGFGRAILAGVERSKGDKIIIMDADGSHNPKYILEMLRKLSEADMVIGSRYVAGGANMDAFARRIASMLFCGAARLLLRVSVRDPMSGFLALRKKVFDEIKVNPLGYKLGLEIIVKGGGKLRILEHPIVFEKCKMGKASIKPSNFKYAAQTILFMLKLITWHSRG